MRSGCVKDRDDTFRNLMVSGNVCILVAVALRFVPLDHRFNGLNLIVGGMGIGFAISGCMQYPSGKPTSEAHDPVSAK
jgi:hypothetical protein